MPHNPSSHPRITASPHILLERHYNSDLSIWLSVDPMSDKYPGVSPYAYCGNNPVRLVDPNGEDWFENEKTGDIYYARDYIKGDENLIGGEGWKWLGKNEMFGKSADEVIYSNYQNAEAEIYTGDATIGRAAFKGENAKKFMGEMGYKYATMSSVVNFTQTQWIGDVNAQGAPVYFYDNSQSEFVISSGYVPIDAKPSVTVTSKTPYDDKQYGPLILKTTWSETRQYSYNLNSSRSNDSMGLQLLPYFSSLVKDVISVLCSNKKK